ncbi:MAG: hypothetical protein ACRC1T_09600 [Clostridium chrysemydis]|uniref:hypothetical protein n=1 Tax=Clostridium chrysemydis TaxID=2665504 RepID=UPI003F2DBB34
MKENQKPNLEIKGLKCDNPSCDYRDDTIPYSEYENYVGKGCPKCGTVLLTEKEYAMCKFLTEATILANNMFGNLGNMETVELSILDKERFENK